MIDLNIVTLFLLRTVLWIMLTFSLLFQAVSGVPEEAGVLFPEKHFHRGELDTMWSLLIMVWYPADFTGMNQ